MTTKPKGESFLQQDPLVNAGKDLAGSAEQTGKDIASSAESTPGMISSWASHLWPGSSDSSDPSPPKKTPDNDTGYAGMAKALLGDYPTAADSVADTPEAMPKSEANAEETTARNQAQAHVLNSSSKGAQPPTTQQDLSAALAPDQAALDQLPAEYKAVMAQLAPYVSGGQNTGNAALNSADASVAQTINQTNGPIEKALSGLGTANKEFAKSVPYQGIIQALLGYGKYQETYEGVLPKTTDWSSTMKDIYDYLSGLGSASSPDSIGGLPSPTAAAAQPGAGTLSSGDSLTGGGNG